MKTPRNPILRLFPCLAFMAGVILLAPSASALTWVDEDNGDPLKFLRSWDPTYSSTFNILNDGYDPTTMQVNSAVASFAFADDGDSTLEYVNVFIDGNLLINGQEVDGTHQNIPVSYDWYSGNLSGSLLAGLQDGVISYSVTITSGDAYLKRAQLVAEGSYRSTETSVPDGGSTALLLGLGLVGLVAARRHVRRLA
jgi:hypothetical protein